MTEPDLQPVAVEEAKRLYLSERIDKVAEGMLKSQRLTLTQLLSSARQRRDRDGRYDGAELAPLLSVTDEYDQAAC
jgi:hypothetical protein